MASKTVAWIYRHTLAVRITHWINVLCLTLLLMSGLQIFNAHPALYWGKASRFDTPFLSMTGRETEAGIKGVTRVVGLEFDTTGVLGVSREQGELTPRGFPAWITVPSLHDLATGRRWHFVFAWIFVINGLAYLFYSLLSGHLWRDLTPSLAQLRGIGRSIIDHALLRFDHGEDARSYNVLQKLAYLGVIAVLAVIVLTGLTMSPGVNAAVPWLVDLFGGRQSARSIHFLCATATVLFVLVHVVMVILTGIWNNVRSMITGNYAIKTTEPAMISRIIRPKRKLRLDRRSFLRGSLAAAGSLTLAGCDRVSDAPWFRSVLDAGEALTLKAQRAVIGPGALAREFTEADISPDFKANGSTEVDDAGYQALAANGFKDFRLEVGGLVNNEIELSLEELAAMPSRTQITRHDCVEGWSSIGKWTGVPLKQVLDKAGVKPNARYVVFQCFNSLEATLDGSGQYYESIGFEDAYHPQTILAYSMNGKALPIAHGAPLRLRVERQLGYKMAKYVMKIELVESFAEIGRGRGSYWADRGYDWYAGI